MLSIAEVTLRNAAELPLPQYGRTRFIHTGGPPIRRLHFVLVIVHQLYPLKTILATPTILCSLLSLAQVTRSLPKFVQDKLDQITFDNGLKGNWDLLLRRKYQLKFVELKRAKKDKIRLTQLIFLKNALACNIPLENFEIFEWVFEK